MLLNFLRITWRRLWRNRLYSLLNILGLSLGLAVSFLIGLYILDELSYNRIFPKQDRTYRAYAQTQDGQIWESPCYAAGPHLKEIYPEVEASARFFSFNDMLLSHGEKHYREDVFGMADPDIFHILDIPLLAGAREDVLTEPDAMVISRETAERFFGTASPIGEVFTVQNDTFSHSFTVRAVMEDAPENSLYPFHFLIPFPSAPKIGFAELEGWDRYGAPTLVLLAEGTDFIGFAKKAEDEIAKNTEQGTNKLLFQPLPEVYLYSLQGAGGRIEYVWIFGIIALFLLLIACINFMNLSTAQSLQRAKEVGVRKTVGASRNDLIRQFFGESLILTLLSGLVALSLMQLLLPAFNQLAGKALNWDSFEPAYWMGFAIILLVTGLLAGSYPALLLSAFKPMMVLKGRFQQGKGQHQFRQLLVVVQFSLSITLIMGTLIAQEQMHYIKKKKLGYEREQVVYIENIGDMMQEYDALKEKLSQSPHVSSITAVSSLPTHIFSHGGTPEFPGRKKDFQLNFLFTLVDKDYLQTFQMEMAEGRFFSFEEEGDSLQSYVINETAARAMGMENPLGNTITYWGMKGQIIGVVKDFQTHGLLEAVKPLIIMLSRDWINQVAIRLAPENTQAGLQVISQAWADIFPHIPLEYHFLDEEFGRQYQTETQTASLFNYLAYLAIFISCLGLFGLAAFTVERRSKEIGLRKVLGASLKDILGLLLWHFTRPVLIAVLIAAPLAWYFMQDWLEGFEYHIQIGGWVLAIATLLVLLIAWITVGFQSVRASLTNPAEVLRNE